MGFIVNGVSSDTFNMAVETTSMPLIAQMRKESVVIPGRNGEYVVEDGYKNKRISFKCTLTDETIAARRRTVREVAKLLSEAETLVYDLEPKMLYTVITAVDNLSSTFEYSIQTEEFTVTFEVAPFQQLSFDPDDLTWESADISWLDADFPWTGQQKTFSVQNGSEIQIVNLGDQIALPLIAISGVATSISFGGLILNNLDGTVYIDCNHYLVYSLNGSDKENRMTDFSGDVIQLQPGRNTLTVSITGGVDVNVSFENVDAYL